MHHGEFNDPCLVEVYDAECPWSRDDEFFLSLVNQRQEARVLDLGCGTGRLTLALAAAGHSVTGVDPALPSLEVARRKPGAETVNWVPGTSSVLTAEADVFDVAVMTSHVAQFFVDDDEWHLTLGHLHRALVSGGSLLFDARDPNARQWERWNPTDSRRRTVLADGRIVSTWTEVTDITDDAVSFTYHYEFPGNERHISTATLRFRSEEQLRTSLRDAGFAIAEIFGGWEGQPVGHGDGEFIVSARA